MLVLYHFKSFTIPSGGLFWLLGWGGEGLRAHPPAYGPDMYLGSERVLYKVSK